MSGERLLASLNIFDLELFGSYFLLPPDQRISCVFHVELVARCTLVHHLVDHIPVCHRGCYIAAATIVTDSEVHPICHGSHQILSIQLLR